MIYYSTGKGTYKRGEVGVAVETDDATAQVLIKKGYLTDVNPLIKVAEKVVEAVYPAEKEIKSEVIVEKPKRKGNPNWGKKK
jgi:hypothetical protein